MEWYFVKNRDNFVLPLPYIKLVRATDWEFLQPCSAW